jgi:hypothetical protein
MNDLLQLPKQFKGKWKHLLILTYGADIPFLENSLWRELSKRCYNKIILADGEQYIKALENCARNRLAHYLNQKYIFDGIFVSHAAHAKCILLTSHEEGRLIVGSGNLGMQGYASGGEIFVQYEYSREKTEYLPAFLSIKEYVDHLIAKEYIGPTAIRHIQDIFTNTPWLYSVSSSDNQPVRHNLDQSFLAQFKEAIGDEEILELWILSPFYDEKAIALRHLLETLRPKKTFLLVQPGQTSIDLAALEKVVSNFPDHCHVHTVNHKENPSVYIHTKLYIAKTANRELCLQGSPNLTQVAMLQSGPQGNAEIANLLDGPPGHFKHLFSQLNIQPEVVDLDSLDLAYQRPEPKDNQKLLDFQLLGGEWKDTTLTLRFRGGLPELDQTVLIIGEDDIPIALESCKENSITLKISDQVADTLKSSTPIRLQYTKDGEQVSTNPIFVCNRQALDNLIDREDYQVSVDEVGSLELEDEELEDLLLELDANLIIDRQSVWRLAGKTIPHQAAKEDEEALHLEYADIDYDMLRKHPKYRHYRGVSGKRADFSSSHNPIQSVLGSIISHFDYLKELQNGKTELSLELTDEDTVEDGETEEEREEEEKERQKRRRTWQSRVRRIFKSFIRRYLSGFQQSDFQAFAGFDVLASNYVIFSHILWKLFFKEWMDDEYIIKALQTLWYSYWGDQSEKGVFESLGEQEQKKTLKIIRHHHTDGIMIASLFYCAYVSHIERWNTSRINLRNFWRTFVDKQPFEISDEVLLDAWTFLENPFPYDTPSPSRIVQELQWLAEFETEKSILQSIEKQVGLPEHCCRFKQQKIHRPSIHDEIFVDCLVLPQNDVIQTLDEAIDILQVWRKLDEREYYRMTSQDGLCLLWYDVVSDKGFYHIKEPLKTVEIDNLPKPSPRQWEEALKALEAIAKNLDADLSFEVEDKSIIRAHHS